MDEVSMCQLCEEPFHVGRNAMGESFYLDRRAVIDPKDHSRILVLAHDDCIRNARIWRQLKEIKRQLRNERGGNYETMQAPGL